MDNSDIQSNNQLLLHEFVVNALSLNSIGSLGHKALLSFEASVRKHGIVVPDEGGLRLWIVDMILSGLKQTTRRRYFNNVHALCRSAYDFSKSDPFENIRSDINRYYDVDLKLIDNNLNLVNRIVSRSSKIVQNKDRNVYDDIFLCLLYDVNATIDSIINFTFDEVHSKLPQIEDIVDKYKKDNRTKYVFDLRQRQVRNPQIIRDIMSGLLKTLTDCGMRFGEAFSRDSIRGIWIAAALRCSISTTEIRSILKTLPKNYEFLEIVKLTDVSVAKKNEIQRKVADYINDNKKYWYAMQLRNGKTPDDVKDKLKVKGYPHLKEIEFYYPTHIVVRKKGKKMNKAEEPYLPGVLFFYLRRDDVKSLFSQYIGDEAWCYRYTNHPDSPYSSISRREMERFQRHIGEFTDDIQMEMVNRDTSLSVNDLVRVYGGVMDGRICRIKEVNCNNGKRTYSLELTEAVSILWTVTNMTETRLEPLSDAQTQAF